VDAIRWDRSRLRCPCATNGRQPLHPQDWLSLLLNECADGSPAAITLQGIGLSSHATCSTGGVLGRGVIASTFPRATASSSPAWPRSTAPMRAWSSSPSQHVNGLGNIDPRQSKRNRLNIRNIQR
jgi:hypothetical protein